MLYESHATRPDASLKNLQIYSCGRFSGITQEHYVLRVYIMEMVGWSIMVCLYSSVGLPSPFSSATTNSIARQRNCNVPLALPIFRWRTIVISWMPLNFYDKFYSFLHWFPSHASSFQHWWRLRPRLCGAVLVMAKGVRSRTHERGRNHSQGWKGWRSNIEFEKGIMAEEVVDSDSSWVESTVVQIRRWVGWIWRQSEGADQKGRKQDGKDEANESTEENWDVTLPTEPPN